MQAPKTLTEQLALSRHLRRNNPTQKAKDGRKFHKPDYQPESKLDRVMRRHSHLPFALFSHMHDRVNHNKHRKVDVCNQAKK